jgi:hypothetical protein
VALEELVTKGVTARRCRRISPSSGGHGGAERERGKDPLVKKVHDSYMGFKKNWDKWAGLSEGVYHAQIRGQIEHPLGNRRRRSFRRRFAEGVAQGYWRWLRSPRLVSRIDRARTGGARSRSCW